MQERKAVSGRIQRWWQLLRELLSRSLSSPRQAPHIPLPGNTPGGGSGSSGEEGRYSVQDSSGGQVGKTQKFDQAKQQWEDLTNSQGRIIDTETGQDVTPENEQERYVVLDSTDQQIGAHTELPNALEQWRGQTSSKGKVIDLKTGKDVTPKVYGASQQMDATQLREVMKAMNAGKDTGHADVGIDTALVAKMLEQINKLKLPVFDISNITGKGNERPTRTVPITRRKVTIETSRKQVWREETGAPQPAGRMEVPYPTEEREVRSIRRPSEIRKVGPRQLAHPLFSERLARRTLPVEVYEEDIPGPPRVQKRRVWQEVETPKIEEWTEEVEVTEDPQAQLLECVVDVSPSMEGLGINLALATVGAVIGRHLDDGSRYFYRQFATVVGGSQKAATTAEKKKLLAWTVRQKGHDLGIGTNIAGAVDAAARDVRAIATREDQPEVLLITDGWDTFSAEDIYRAVGDDVVLHTIVVGDASNSSLKQHSSTYCELNFDGSRVLISEAEEH